MKSIFLASKKVFRNKSYAILAVLIAILFYSLNALISGTASVKQIFSSYAFTTALKLTFLSIVGFRYLIKPSTFITLIIISVLFGVLFSFIAYKTKNIKEASAKKIGVLGTLGIFLGIIAPGCAACGVGLASVLGLSAFLAFLPFEGLEVSILSIILLVIANLNVSKGLLKENICQIEQGDERGSNKWQKKKSKQKQIARR